MRRFALVVTLVFVASVAHAAPRGKPFAPNGVKLAELTSLNEKSIQKDESGNTPICEGCAKPQDFLDTLRLQNHTRVPDDTRDFPQYLKTLEERPLVGEYWLACLDAVTGKPIAHCVSRYAAPSDGEMGAYDRVTGRLVFRLKCSNPAEKEVKEQCVYKHFFTKPGDKAVRFALLGPYALSDDCIGVKKAGEIEWQNVWANECASEDCTFASAAAFIGQPILREGSYVPEPGEHILRLPADVAKRDSLHSSVLCKESEFEYSDGRQVTWEHYVYRTRTKAKKAIVWYDRSVVPDDAPKIYWTSGDPYGPSR